MALSSASSLNSDILALSPSAVQSSAINLFVDVIGSFTDNIQASPGGTPGILTFNRPAMIAILLTQAPTAGSDWIAKMADAWEAGINSATITPGTVTNGAWAGSGGKDVVASVSNVSAAKSVLASQLASVTPDSSAALPMANAFRNAALTLQFECSGVGPPPDGSPVSLTLNAE